MGKFKNAALVLAIFVVSIFFVLMWGAFNSETFLFDDNRNQWFPIIEKAYEEFFATGRIPVYDFYQLKGMAISEPGYYSIMNPLMLLSYAISRLGICHFSIVTVYICIMTALGNVFMYAAARAVKLNKKMSTLTVMAYTSCSAFLSFSYWYYIYSNYLIIPLLLFAFIKLRNKKSELFVIGVILAFDLLLGNVQYTCYHYIIYCIMCIVMIILRNKRYIKVMVSNIIVGLLLSIPSFVLLLNASNGFTNGGFRLLKLKMSAIVFNSFIPMGILKKFGIDENNPILDLPFLTVNVMEREDRLLLFTGACVVPLVIIAVYYIKKVINKLIKISADKSEITLKEFAHISCICIKKNYIKMCELNFEKQLVVALVVVLLCFLSLVSCGIIAVILSQMPVIKNFRFLFKAFFALVPILAFFTIIVIDCHSGKLRKATVIVCLLFCAIGFVNNYFTLKYTLNSSIDGKGLFVSHIDTTMDKEAEYTCDLLSKSDIDNKNYRAICLLKSDAVTEETFDYANNLSRNYPTYIERFSLGAYEVSASEERMNQYNMILAGWGDFTNYSNAGVIRYFVSAILSSPDEVERQLINNSVKYLIVQNDEFESNTLTIIENLNTLNNISVARTGRFSEGYDFIELNGVNSLFVNENGETMELFDEGMDLLSFEADDSAYVTASFAYDKNLVAYSINSLGEYSYADITVNDYQNAVIDLDGHSGERIYLGYKNPVCVAGFAMEIVISLLFILALMILFFGKYHANNKI